MTKTTHAIGWACAAALACLGLPAEALACYDASGAT